MSATAPVRTPHNICHLLILKSESIPTSIFPYCRIVGSQEVVEEARGTLGNNENPYKWESEPLSTQNFYHLHR